MSDEKERITISIPEEEEDLLDDIDELVEKGLFDDRTEVILYAIDRKTGEHRGQKYGNLELYDAAHSSYAEAGMRGNYRVKRNAREHILRNWGETRTLHQIDRLLER